MASRESGTSGSNPPGAARGIDCHDLSHEQLSPVLADLDRMPMGVHQPCYTSHHKTCRSDRRAGTRKPGGKCRRNYMVERVRKHEVVGSFPTCPATGDSSVKKCFASTLLPSAFRASRNDFSECRRNYIDPEGPQAEKPGQRRPRRCGAEELVGNCFRTFCH